MFNKELFYSLCEKYEVELSDKYEKVMIKDNEEIREIDEFEIKRTFTNFRTYFSYDSIDVKTMSETSPSYDFSEYPIAC